MEEREELAHANACHGRGIGIKVVFRCVYCTTGYVYTYSAQRCMVRQASRCQKRWTGGSLDSSQPHRQLGRTKVDTGLVGFSGPYVSSTSECGEGHIESGVNWHAPCH